MDEKEIIASIEILAHKIKNPVHAAMLNLDVVQVKLKKQKTDKALLKHLEIVSQELQRLNHILQSYFNYLKLSDRERKKKDLRKILS